MSIRHVESVWTLTLEPTVKLVLLAYADHADQRGICWPKKETIALKCGLNLRTVQRALTELAGRDLLRVVRYPHGGRGRTTEYLVNVPVRPDSSPLPLFPAPPKNPPQP